MPFMRYVVARYNQYQRETTYRICVTDPLRIITENTSASFGGKAFTARWIELVKPEEKEDSRTAQEVIQHIRDGLGRLGDNERI